MHRLLAVGCCLLLSRRCLCGDIVSCLWDGDCNVNVHNYTRNVNYTSSLELYRCIYFWCVRSVIGAYGLRRGQPQTYGIGLKELWQVPAGHAHYLPGLVEHTVGWPSVRTPVLSLRLLSSASSASSSSPRPPPLRTNYVYTALTILVFLGSV